MKQLKQLCIKTDLNNQTSLNFYYTALPATGCFVSHFDESIYFKTIIGI